MNLKHIRSDDKGVSEVIGSVLILTILVAFLGILQAYYVPKWNNDVEASHFNDLYDDALDLKRIMQDTAVYDLPRTAVIHTSLYYPERMFLLNPSRPSGMITTRFDKKVILTYNKNITEKVNSCTVRITEGYNYFNAPTLVLEHGMILGEYGKKNYMIDEPLLNNVNIDLLLIDCGNSSLGTMSSSDFRIYPLMLGNIMASNASITFDTDYPDVWNGYLNSIKANFTTSGNAVTVFYNNMTKIRVMRVKIGEASSFSIMPQPAPGPLSSILITPPITSIMQGDTQQFSASGFDSNGTSVPVTPVWDSSNISVGTISSSGLFTAINPGTTTITATNGSVSSNLTIVVWPVPGKLLLDSFETVLDKGYSRSGSGSYSQNVNSTFVTHFSGSLAMSYDFSSNNANDKLVVEINYNRYTPPQSYNISNFTYIKLDVYGDNSGQNTSISIRGGHTTYEWQPIIINWNSWNTISLPLSMARTSGVDLTSVEKVEIKISETSAIKKIGAVYYDYLRGEN